MKFSDEVLEVFPGICVAEGNIRSVQIEGSHPGLETLKSAVSGELQTRHTLDQVRDDPIFRAYRDFFWRVGIDPTKTRPASEALVRRILAERPLPIINTAVDAYNLASASSGIPIAAFDEDLLTGSLTLRFATKHEQFLGIGMNKPVTLSENQVIMTDEEEIIAIYPYRDSDVTKVTAGTKHIHIVSCGVPNIERERVIGAYMTCMSYLERYTMGIPSAFEVYP